MGCGLSSSDTAGQRNSTIAVSGRERASLAGGQHQYDSQVVPNDAKLRSSPTELSNGKGVGPSHSSSPRRSGGQQSIQDLTMNDLGNNSSKGYSGTDDSQQPVVIPRQLEIFSSADQSTETMDIIVSQPSTQKHSHGKVAVTGGVDGDSDRPATQRHGTVVLATDGDPNQQRICLQSSNSQTNLVSHPLPGFCQNPNSSSTQHAFPSRYSDTASSTSHERGGADHHDSLSLGGYSTTSYSSSRNSSTTESRTRTASSDGVELDTYCLQHTTSANHADNPLSRQSGTTSSGTAPPVAVAYAPTGLHSSDSVVSSASGSPTRVSRAKRTPFFLVSRDDPKERAHEEYHHLVVKHTEWVLSQQPGAKIGGRRLAPELGPGPGEEEEEEFTSNDQAEPMASPATEDQQQQPSDSVA